MDSSGNQPGYEICISGLHFRTSVEDIFRAFSMFGDLLDCRLLINDRLESKKVAFAVYANESDAKRAIEFMNGYNIDGRQILVEASRFRKTPSK